MDKKMDTAEPSANRRLRNPASRRGRSPRSCASSLRGNPSWRSEHLTQVPADVLSAWRWLPELRLEERLADEPEHQLLCSATASNEVCRDGNLVVVTHTQDAAVEEFVMEAAEAQPVLHRVRTLEGPPTQMGGVESDGFGAEAPVVAAHRALVLVGDEHQLTESGVTPSELLHPCSSGGNLESFDVERGRLAQLAVQ